MTSTNNSLDFKALRESITPESIKSILGRFDVSPARETEKAIIFPTCCHNLTGGSNKLYYYKDSYLFKCYTECEGTFDIFDLVMRMNAMRGIDCTLMQALQFCGVELGRDDTAQEIDHERETNLLYNALHTDYSIQPIQAINIDIRSRFYFDKEALSAWKNEGISYSTMKKYGIQYDPITNCIIIPNVDQNGKLIGVRGRFLDPDADAKYRPIVYNKTVLNYPTSLTLYGLYQNKASMRRKGQAIIFEGEKSVLMMDTYYGKDSTAVATLGKNISMQQIRLLLEAGVREVALAYDADYYDQATMFAKRKEYLDIAKRLQLFFNVCVVMDLSCKLLNYKDSPIDRGKETFERLLKDRIYIK